MNEFTLNLTIEREETATIGFTEDDVDRSVSVRADVGDRTVQVETSPDDPVAPAVEEFLDQLGLDSIDLGTEE